MKIKELLDCVKEDYESSDYKPPEFPDLKEEDFDENNFIYIEGKHSVLISEISVMQDIESEKYYMFGYIGYVTECKFDDEGNVEELSYDELAVSDEFDLTYDVNIKDDTVPVLNKAEVTKTYNIIKAQLCERFTETFKNHIK